MNGYHRIKDEYDMRGDENEHNVSINEEENVMIGYEKKNPHILERKGEPRHVSDE